MKFKHIDTCWYFNKLDHRGKPYEWPCCGETTECDDAFVNSLKAENARLREALELISSGKTFCSYSVSKMDKKCANVARAALDGHE